MRKIAKFICRAVGHKFAWTAVIDRDGFICARCACRVRSMTGRDAKLDKAKP